MDIKRDILGRELHDYDLVVFKGSGGFDKAAKPMEVGIFLGKSVRTLTTTKSCRDMFLIENPGEMELHIKNKIMEKLDEEAKEKKSKKTQVANVEGTIYMVSRNKEVFLYCGKRKVSVYKNGVLLHQNTGHLYLSGKCHLRNDTEVHGYTFDTFLKRTKELLAFGCHSDIKAQQSIKNYEKVYHQVTIPASFQVEGVNHWKEGKWNGHSSYKDVTWIEYDDEYIVVVESV